MEVERIFKENRCSQCEKMFKTKDQQVIHLLYNHTKWIEVIATEADMVMEKSAGDEMIGRRVPAWPVGGSWNFVDTAIA